MTVAIDTRWSAALDAIQRLVSPTHFDAWYRPARLLAVEAAPVGAIPASVSTLPAPAIPAAEPAAPAPAFLLAVASTYAANLLNDELAGKIGRAAAPGAVFRVIVRPDLFNAARSVPVDPGFISNADAALAAESALFVQSTPSADSPDAPAFPAWTNQATAAPAHSPSQSPAAARARSVTLSSAEGVFQITLATRFDLSAFVPGPENAFAQQGVRMVVERPGARFNTLFLHGPAGSGKSHLLQAACLEIHRRHPHLKLLYLSCEQWVNAYLEYTKNHRLDIFRRAVRSVDVLAVDDIQFLLGKKGSQREFLYMVEALLMNGKQLLLASPLPPQGLKTLDARLVERFYSSLVCPLEKPGEALREAIAADQFRRQAVPVTRDALRHLARQESASLHELGGRVNMLTARAAGQPIGLTDMKQWLGPGETDGDQGVLFPNRRARPIAMARILDRTAEYFHIKPEDIRGRRRSRSVLQARVVACKLARDLSGKSLQEIGRWLGDRSHATVLHCLRRFDVRRGVDKDLADAYHQLSNELTAP